jgi:hypothetical protein
MKIHSSHKDINCSIIDLRDRNLITNTADKKIAADLANRMLQKAVKSQAGINIDKFILIYQHHNHTKKLYSCVYILIIIIKRLSRYTVGV